MRLTRFTDNALRCLLALGLEPRTTHTVGAIALRMRMSEEHLMKVVRRLSQLGYITTSRGRGGGIRLAVEPAEINIGTLLRQTEENLALVECFAPASSQCPIASACVLAGAIDNALAAFLGVLDRYTLEDMLQPRVELVRLLSVSGADGERRPDSTPPPLHAVPG
jgi:Rrf2 family transcriptional regulator, nitric oxide-sensitive transcriptional repressor